VLELFAEWEDVGGAEELLSLAFVVCEADCGLGCECCPEDELFLREALASAVTGVVFDCRDLELTGWGVDLLITTS
jgi:hypothetical protein